MIKRGGITFLVVREAAELARVPVKTVNHWINSGQLPSAMFGNVRVIRESVLVKWLEGEDVRKASDIVPTGKR